jgi:hypothetical protein
MIAAIERAMTRKTLRGGRMLAAVLALAPLTDAAVARSGRPEVNAPGPGTKTPGVPANTEGLATLKLSATLGGSDGQPIRGGLVWRIFEEAVQPDGSHKLVAQLDEASPTVPLPDGAYVVQPPMGWRAPRGAS